MPEIDAYDYELDSRSIAQVPAEPRDSARLLDARDLDRPVERAVHDLPALLTPDDLVVVNDTRVRPARLLLTKATGGAAEVLLLAPTGDPGEWNALVKPGRRLPPGTVLFTGPTPVVEVGERKADGIRAVRILDEPTVAETGRLPLPPYIHRQPADPDRYQTVYANRAGSVAAPTAGLHFTPELLGALDERGIGRVSIDLEVGLGTFAPVTAGKLDDHRMHVERYRVTPEAWERIRAAGRVIAIGTTVVRCIETVAAGGGFEGETSIFIRPGFPFAEVDVLLTNFHMPKSTLLVLLEAFVGPRWRELYAGALGRGFGVGSFGDAMLVARRG